MDTQRTLTDKRYNKLLWTLPYIIVCIGLLFSFFGLSEFYNVKIAGHESEYPFGPVNDNSWFYQSATTYANYNLTSGVIFLIVAALTAYATIKKNRALVFWGTGLTILFFISEMVNIAIE